MRITLFFLSLLILNCNDKNVLVDDYFFAIDKTIDHSRGLYKENNYLFVNKKFKVPIKGLQQNNFYQRYLFRDTMYLKNQALSFVHSYNYTEEKNSWLKQVTLDSIDFLNYNVFYFGGGMLDESDSNYFFNKMSVHIENEIEFKINSSPHFILNKKNKKVFKFENLIK